MMTRAMNGVIPFFLVSSIVGAVSLPQVDETPTEEFVEVSINMRRLGPEEKQEYERMRRLINESLSTGALSLSTVTALLNTIDDLPGSVDEDTRFSLRSYLDDAVGDRVHPIDPFALELLASDDPRVVDVGFSVLQPSSADWLVDPRVKALLWSFLSSDTASDHQRFVVLWVFELGGFFEEVKNHAYDLARDESRPQLARDAASLLAAHASNDECERRRLFAGSRGILRQQAALALANNHEELLPEILEKQVITTLLDMVTDSSLPAPDRGDAIEALEWFDPNDRIRATLLEMLRPKNWFFGVSGQHYALHSLVPLVDALSDYRDPEVTSRLETLRDSVRSQDFYEGDLEWALDSALAAPQDVTP